MRICHIISGDLWAGAEVMNYRLMKRLKNISNIELSAGKLEEVHSRYNCNEKLILFNDCCMFKNGQHTFVVSSYKLKVYYFRLLPEGKLSL
jgi:hypothetical protein